MKRSNYVIERETEYEIVLHDIGPWDIFLTITNDAENIISALSPEQKNKRVFYYDSENVLTELVIINDDFSHFRDISNPLNVFFDKGLS